MPVNLSSLWLLTTFCSGTIAVTSSSNTSFVLGFLQLPSGSSFQFTYSHSSALKVTLPSLNVTSSSAVNLVITGASSPYNGQGLALFCQSPDASWQFGQSYGAVSSGTPSTLSFVVRFMRYRQFTSVLKPPLELRLSHWIQQYAIDFDRPTGCIHGTIHGLGCWSHVPWYRRKHWVPAHCISCVSKWPYHGTNSHCRFCRRRWATSEFFSVSLPTLADSCCTGLRFTSTVNLSQMVSYATMLSKVLRLTSICS